jgi:hypothetical protein
VPTLRSAGLARVERLRAAHEPRARVAEHVVGAQVHQESCIVEVGLGVAEGADAEIDDHGAPGQAPPAEPGDHGQGERDRQECGARQRLRAVAFGPRSHPGPSPRRAPTAQAVVPRHGDTPSGGQRRLPSPAVMRSIFTW